MSSSQHRRSRRSRLSKKSNAIEGRSLDADSLKIKSHRKTRSKSSINSPRVNTAKSGSSKDITYISLFSGIGGFELGIHSIFPSAKCLGFSEIDPSAIEVYKEQFPDHKALGNIRDIDGTIFKGKVTLLVGGSPCQDLSRIGTQNGLEGEKSSLVYEFVRLLREIQPKFFILENVKMKQADQDVISKLLKVQPIELDSNIASFQSRKRLYWCNFDIAKLTKRPVLKGTVKNILLAKTDPRLKEITTKDLTRPYGRGECVVKNMLKNIKDPLSRYYRITYPSDPCTWTLMCSAYGNYYVFIKDYTVRFFHPIEWERLQTFPDDWTIMCPNSKRVRLLGNAVTVNVIALICSCLKSHIMSSI